MEQYIYLEVGILAIFPIFLLIREKGLKLYHPALLLSFIYFFEFGIPSLFMAFEPFWFPMTGLQSIQKALIFIILVFLFFVLGFYSVFYNKNIKVLVLKLIEKIPTVNDYKIEITNLPVVLIFLFVVGWIARILVIKMGMYYHTEVGYNQVQQPTGFKQFAPYISVGSTFPLIGLSLCFFEWLKNQKKYSFLMISFLC